MTASNFYKSLAASALLTFGAPLALADEHGGAEDDVRQSGEVSIDQDEAQAQARGQAQHTAGTGDMQTAEVENAVSAGELMAGDVVNVSTPVGQVRDLILNEQGDAVEYVLYEVPYPYAYQGARDGFVRFDDLAIEDRSTFETQLRFDDEAAAQAPEELTLTRGQADHRLVSRILDSSVTFSEGQETRDVEDLLIDRESGRVVGYVVNRNPDAWFNDQPVRIPPDQVTVGEGGDVTTEAEFAALEALR